MTTYTEATDKVQAQVLDGIKQFQAASLQLAATFSRSAGSMLPMPASLPVDYDPKQFIERSFAFTGNVLELQKDYLVSLAETLKPVAATNSAAARASKTA
ncbi:MAG: hypothetical protein QOK05_1414 [Chloroflexota bacterium]|jgi:hypothetical protein|nr:hypothetical protein [Chloroflexota bacterium]